MQDRLTRWLRGDATAQDGNADESLGVDMAPPPAALAAAGKKHGTTGGRPFTTRAQSDEASRAGDSVEGL